MTIKSSTSATRLITFCGQCNCGCYIFDFHSDNPGDREYSIANDDPRLGIIYFGKSFLRQLIAEAPSGAKGLIVHHPGNAPEQEYSISAGDATVYISAEDRADLLRRASDGELETIVNGSHEKLLAA
jgi:hypothetical protein